jgi:amino acid adenylation domain-containing protein
MVLPIMVATAPELGQGVSPRRLDYNLAPMQAGMLFQALLNQQDQGLSGGYDIEQIHMLLDEEIDPASLARAFDLVTARHPVLSTSFSWEERGEPQQRLNDSVSIPLAVEDWRRTDEKDTAVRRRAYLERDRARGFDLRKPPLMRLGVFRRKGGRTEVVWTFHHILIDGRCFATLLDEAFDAYAAVAAGGTWEPPLAPRPYRDFIDWLDARDECDKAASQAFFHDLLAGKAAPTPLPTAEPAARPLSREGYGERLTSVDGRVVARLRKLAEETGTTVATAVHAAWALVLARYSGEDDVLFGSARACRRSALGSDGDAMIGLFMNTLPVRARVDGARTVAELLTELREQSVAMRDHEHARLVDIHAASAIPGGTSLFETMLLYESHELNRTLRASGDPRWQRRRFTIHEQPALPLTIKVFEGERFEVHALYDRRRFYDAAIARLLGSLVAALERLAEDAQRPLGAIDVLPEVDRRRIVHNWNGTARTFPDRLRIHELFERRADEQPQATAVEFDQRLVSYRELEQQANQLAHALRTRGAGPGKYVGICLSRGPELVAAMLGVAKSGAAYVPLDPRYPAERLAFMIEDTAALAVVTERRHQPQLGEAQLLVIDGADGIEELARQPASRPPPISEPTDACYAIFTSGSTGNPKGAVLSHRAVVNTLDWVSRTFEVGPGDRLLFVTSPCFDLSVYDTFGALGAGATVVVASEALLADPQALARAITDQRITIWDSAPAALQRLVPFFPIRSAQPPLRLVMLSGDWIPLTLPDEIRGAFSRAQVVSLGGATEAAIWSNYFCVSAVDPRWTSIPYGRPIQNARYYILDAGMRPLPVGVTGELYISGTCLADGYLNRPDLTAERFLPDHLSGLTGERLYKTGDLARFVDQDSLEEGTIELLGRADFQVKIRGFRVEMGEVEAALCALPGVREAVASAYTDASGQKSLAAYVVPADGQTLDSNELRDALAKKLPDFMTPSQVLVLGALPLSSNGKVDRKALPSPTARPAESTFVLPRTETEKVLAGIWSELLGRDPIGSTDNFFALGGHSLLAVMLVGEIKGRLGTEVPLSAVLEHPTVEALARMISRPPSAETQPRHLITLRATGDRPPIVLVAGVGGYAFTYQGLAELLGPTQPVYALKAIGAERDADLVDRSIEEVAAIYETEILDAFPPGPIVLGGFSMGMLPAFELAYRLRERGRPVPLLVSFDGFAPGYPQRLSGAQRWAAHARELWETKDRKAYVEERLEHIKGRVLAYLGRAAEAAPKLNLDVVDEELNEHLRKLWVIQANARQRYRPTHAEPSALLLIRSEVPMHWPATKMDDPLHGWYSFVRGPISLVTIPGDHLSLFSPQNQPRMAEAIAEQVQRYAVSAVAAGPAGVPTTPGPSIVVGGGAPAR